MDGMTRLPYLGLALHGVLFVALVGACAFDDGHLAHDWRDCLIPLGSILVPFVLGAVGTRTRSSGVLVAAALIGLVVGLLSATGPGLFVLAPAIIYGMGAARIPAEP